MSDPHNHAYKMAGSTQVLPQFVTEWAGLKDDNPYVCFKDEVKPIAEVNDKGATFTEIAQLIEEQLWAKLGGEYYDAGRKSSRPVIPGSRKGLTSQERQRRREEDENVDTRFGTKTSGKYGITRSPNKLRKQRAMGELN